MQNVKCKVQNERNGVVIIDDVILYFAVSFFIWSVFCV